MELFSKYIVLSADKTKNEFWGNKPGPFDAGIPLLDISDPSIQEIYYYRWDTYFKHVKNTPDGYVVTEFLPDVPWAGKYNTISCPAGHHLYEGRWIHNGKYIDDYAKFWFTEGAEPRRYSFWAADAVLAVCQVRGVYACQRAV